MILGKNLILTVGDESRGLAASKSCYLSIDTDFIEVCSPVNGSWKEYLPTINSWSASVDTLVASLSDHKVLIKKQDNKEKLMCCFFDTDLQEYYKGQCYIKNVQIKGTEGSLASMVVSLQPTGPLELSEEVIVDMQDGESETGVALSYDQITNRVLIGYSLTGSGVLIKEIMIDNDTRITLDDFGVVVNANGYLDVKTMLTNKDSSALNAAAVLINSKGSEKSVILKKQSASYNVYALVNSNTPSVVKYLSKF